MTTTEKENPWHRLYATVAAVLADPTHEESQIWYEQLKPIVDQFIESGEPGDDPYDAALWLLIFQQRWFEEGRPGHPFKFASREELREMDQKKRRRVAAKAK